MTESEAKRWLGKFIEEQGVNSDAHLARSQSSLSLLETQQSCGGLGNSSLAGNHPRKAAWAASFRGTSFHC